MTEFSADVTYFDDHKLLQSSGRIFVANDSIREERKSSDSEVIRITDMFRGIAYVLEPGSKEYYQQEALAVPRDPARFCAEMMLLECGYRGEKEIDGRVTEHWSAELGFGDLSIGVSAWYDPTIQYPVRIELNDGAALQLSNIQIARPPSSLFSIPYNYRMVEQTDSDQSAGFPEWP
ncbi:MAG: hypothetical protein H8D24_02850 [Gammaproteobacteria bacterium]|uniref:Uncharacterized protein n=1 Tax=Candidatus Thiopontia autotrophica TaxID=2841688 RepID=A0A8J6TVQ8_9GAMM|nr:hypothetical protein [Candidatus Thiopontia autotrophica]